MSKSVKIVACVLLALFCASSLFAAHEERSVKEAWPAYIFTVFLGFGSGHFYLGEGGIGFLLGDLAGYAGVIAGTVYLLTQMDGFYTYDYTDASTDALIAYGLMAGGALITSISRIWEIVSIFGAVDRATREGRVVEFRPLLDIQPTSLSVGVSLSY